MNSQVVCYFNGSFVPLQDAKVGVMTHAFNYGTACFEGIRAYWNADERQLYAFRLADHFDRLRRSAHMLMIELPHDRDTLCEITRDLLERNAFEGDVYVRPLAYLSSEMIGVRLHNVEHGFVIYAVPFGDYIETGGIRAITSSWRRIDDNAAPARAKLTGIYVNSAFAKTEAFLNGADEAIMLTDDGHVSEGSAENLFALVAGELVTPPPTDNILLGITRDTVIRLAEDRLGMQVCQRSIDRSELYGADELFLCGTGAQIVPITQLDHRAIGGGRVGPVTTAISRGYMDVVHGRDGRYQEWLTPVYQREPDKRP
ncbi:MAG TPA: branched-chain amino acid transaminase [Thermomicrobiaceae bacterium]|nr:branched-chain amino acid transaminase [Thermomicrobiaceae bacterium]